MDKMLKLTIPAALFSAGLIAFTGCKQKEVLADRPYIAAPVSDVSVPPAPPVTMMPNSNVIAPAQNTEEGIIVEETAFTTVSNENDLPEVSATPEPAPKTSRYPKFVGAKTKPAVTPYKPAAAKSNAVAGKDVYVVQKNDTLSQIAYRHGVKTADLAAVNGISTNSIIRVGQKLKMPAGSKKVQNVKTSSAPAKNTSAKTSIAKAEYPADGVYTIKSGDSLWLIARRFDTTVAKICEANNISADARLQIGQKIKLPGANASSSSSTATKTTTTAPAATTTTAPATATPATNNTTTTEDNTAPAKTDNAVNTTAVNDTNSQNVTATETPAATTTPEIPVTAPAEITTQTAVIHQDIMLESYCKIYRWNLDEVLKLNPNLNKDSILKAGETIVLPSSTN